MKRSAILGVVIGLSLIFAACGDANASGNEEDEPQQGPASSVAPDDEAVDDGDAGDSSQAASDGGSVTERGITLRWRVNGDALEVSVTAPTTGWIAVGFEPSRAMKDANILIGYVAGSEVVVTDQFGTTMVQHAQDSSLGGTTDVTVLGGSEADGATTIEFSIPLDSGDEYDQPLEPGSTIAVILAYGEDGADDLTSYHRDRAAAEITL